MALKLVMNSDGTINHASGSTITGGTFTIESSPSSNVTISDSGVYSGDLVFTFTGGTIDPDPGETYVAGSAVILIGAPGTISPTADKTSVDGEYVIRVDDNVTEATFTVELTAGGTTTVVGPVEVDDAGQDKVTAE